MDTDYPQNMLEKIIAGIIVLLKWVGSVSLALMMFLTAVDVACRYLFNSPIAGALELVEYMMAVLIPFSVAYCGFCKSHVAVEFIMDQFPRKLQGFVDVCMSAITLVFLMVITWQTCLYVVETFESKLTSSVLLIVAYPFVIPIALGMAVFSLVILNDLIKNALKRGKK